MNKNLIPDYYLKDIFSINSEWLKSLQITTIFIDLDNTLANPYVATPSEEVIQLIEKLKDFKLVVLSNNHEARVQRFVEKLNIEYIYEVKKPSPKKVLAYINKHHLSVNQCMGIGDQIMTDVLCANRVQMTSVLVDPLTNQDEPITFFPRLLDRHFRKIIQKKKLTKEL